ncbi:MAG: peptidoglycan-binding protein [Gemmataceae bacterium]|nr:peptidoglycan-binding protein [Gemmataceae bacterium]MCI0737547.1 peptidoglycan-binding protein [Gemmataceae bacterium]
MYPDLVSQNGKKACLFFNVDAHVGPNCQNKMDDVMLVQYLMRKLAEAGIPADNPAVRTTMSDVSPTGQFDATTGEGIRAFQEYMRGKFGGVVDGRVSPAKGPSYGNGVYTIYNLNCWMRGAFANVWPRLQDLGDCPGLLKNVIPMML